MATKKENKKLEKTAAPLKKATAFNSSKPKAVEDNKTQEVVIDAVKSTNENLDIILELKNITKTFLGGKIVANDDVSLSFARNEVHAIVGENGSGKSTLMNIIFGLYKQDKGTVLLNKKKVDMYQSGAAKKHKIGMVHQHFHLVDAFTVLENVILGQEELTKHRNERKKIKELKHELREIKAELRTMRKWDSMKIKHKKTGARTQETDVNFVAAVLKVQKIKHDARVEIEKEENIIRELKTERARLSIHNKHHVDRMEAINDEILDRKDVIAEEEHALNLSYTYEHSAQNADQERVVELAERQFIATRELHLLDVHLTGRFGKIKHKEVMSRLREIQIKYNIHLDPYAKVSELSVGKRQMVEILKVLWEDKDIIVFDEPTATLSVVEIEALIKIIQALKEEGKTIIFISHKLKEVKAIADRVSVLRKGVMMGTYENNDKLKPSDIGKLMVGKTIDLKYPARKISDKPLLKFENVSYRTHTGFKAVDDVSFEIHEGEIFGLAGIEGNGQEEILKMLTNLRKLQHGSISIMREVGKKEAKHLMKENALIEHDRILHQAHKDEEKLQPKYLESLIKKETKKKIRAAKMEALDLMSEVIAIEGKEGKPELRNIKKELHKTIHDIKKEEHHEIKVLHSHKNMKSLHKQIKDIHSKAKKDAKAVVTNANKRIRNKDFQTTLWDRLADHENGYHLNSTERRLIQSHVPIDRLKHGVVPSKDLEFNAKITDFDTKFLSKDGKHKKVNKHRLSEFTDQIINGMNVDGAFNHQVEIRNLSGGNQQKFVVGREIFRDHKIFVAGHPTRGLDISAIDHIYKTMIENSEGKATLLYSLEINELLAVCDRVAIMYHGKIMDIIDPKKTSLAEVSRMMIGEVE